MCPWGRRLINGDGSALAPGRLVCHVLLIEAPGGLALVDTGFGSADVGEPKLLARSFRLLTRPTLQLGETACSLVRELGFSAEDVRHILLTHLDIDHAGGLPDFPHAQVHVSAREHATMGDPPARERRRYRIAAHDWAHGPRWVTHELAGEEWMGFDGVRVLSDLGAEILFIPLHGHTLGHAGVAVRDQQRWLLHCGDAYFHHDEISAPPRCPPGLRAFQSLVQADGRLRRENQERLRELARRRTGEVELLCSHDPAELAHN